jgi:hypothetical protein
VLVDLNYFHYYWMTLVGYDHYLGYYLLNCYRLKLRYQQPSNTNNNQGTPNQGSSNQDTQQPTQGNNGYVLFVAPLLFPFVFCAC